MATRTHATQISDPKEFWQMMHEEAQRPVVSEAHFPDFSVVEEWLKLAGDTHNFFRLETIEEMYKTVELVKQNLINFSHNHTDSFIFKKIEAYLGEEDTITDAVDLGFVFGSKSLLRVETAIELYKKGLLKKLVMIGKGPHYETNELTEAEVFKQRALELGVSENDILLETESFNIAGNVRGTLNMLDELNIPYKSVVLVIPWYALRRTWVYMKKYAPLHVEPYRVAAALSVGSKYAKGEWFRYQEGVEVVFNEFVKLRHQVITNTG